MSTSTAAVPRPRLPSISEIEKSLRERLPGLTIYNPSDRWIQLEVFGLTHLWATPDLGGAIEAHPVTREPITCDGRTMIRGRYPTINGQQQKDSSGKVIEGQDAPAMVKTIVDPNRYGQMGLVYLPGVTIEEDQKYVDLARAVWLDFQRQQDEMIVSKRAEFKSNWTKSPHHKGEPCPPPTATENAAMDRLQQRKRAVEWKFECPVVECPGYASNDWTKFSDHMRLAHNQANLDRSKYEVGEGQVAGVVAPPAAPAPLAEKSLEGGIAAAVAAATPPPGPEPEAGADTDTAAPRPLPRPPGLLEGALVHADTDEETDRPQPRRRSR